MMRHPLSLLKSLQQMLAAIYDAPLKLDVTRFLITERDRLPAPHRDTDSDEQVLVARDDEGLRIGVFLDGAMLDRLSRADPFTLLSGDNLGDYWTALEGVSHFHYLAWNTGYGRPVTLHELELQAEIDKYVSSLWLLRKQHPHRFPVELHTLLFDRCRLRADLSGEHRQMYQRANDYAARFCRRIAQRLSSSLVSARLETMAELRRFYRLGHHRKFRHIEYAGQHGRLLHP